MFLYGVEREARSQESEEKTDGSLLAVGFCLLASSF